MRSKPIAYSILMLQQLANTLGRVYFFLTSLVVTAVLCLVTWACWQYYQETRLQNQFAQEGQLVAVTVEHAAQKQLSWRDALSHSTYLTFRHKGKEYTTRYVMDSSYVGSGDRVQLLYHPAYDAFRQARNEIRFDRSVRKSRLVDWTTIRTFTDENRLLLLCIMLATVSFFLLTGVIATIMPVGFLQSIARLVLTVELVIATIFLTYDTYQYFQYYQHLKANGHEVAVRVLDTHRRLVGNNTKSTAWKMYTYDATIRYQQQERIIPISDDDFETLKPGDTAKTYYDESVNDFMSVNFPPNYWAALLPLFFGFLTLLSIRSARGSKRQKGQTLPAK